jgi:hypothetical protein
MFLIRKETTLCVIAFLSFSIAASAESLVRRARENRPFQICTAEKGQTVPEVVCGGQGQFLVVWNDQRNAEMDEDQRKFFDIFAALVHAGDGRTSVPFCVSGTNRALDTYSRAAAAYNGLHEEYLVCWSDQEKVFGRRIGSDASLIDDTFVIDDCASGFLTVTFNALDPSYLITYQGEDEGLKGLILEPNGMSLDEPFLISAVGSAQQVVYNAVQNEFMIAYAAGVSRIMMRAAGSNGKLGSEIEVCDAAFIQYYPTIAHNAMVDEYLVVWHDERHWEDYCNELYAKSFSSSGSATSGEYLIVGGTEDMLHAPHLAFDPVHGGYVLTWSHQHGFINYEFEVMALRLDSRGRGSGEGFSLRKGGIHHQDSARIAFDPHHGKYLVVFEQSQGLFDDGTDIYGQFFGASAALPQAEDR